MTDVAIAIACIMGACFIFLIGVIVGMLIEKKKQAIQTMEAIEKQEPKTPLPDFFAPTHDPSAET